tara:strand:+ start:12078 stop:12209 length:132 start_codon:yes stop_codon:yes gene_type:complete
LNEEESLVFRKVLFFFVWIMLILLVLVLVGFGAGGFEHFFQFI